MSHSRTPCHGRPAEARRFLFTCTRFLVVVGVMSAGAASAASAAPAQAADVVISGVVLDQAGHPLPRAHVRLLDAPSAHSAATFADETGHFRIAAASGACRVEVTLTGFEPATVPCSTTAELRVELGLAPIQETVVVTATDTPTPASQTGDSVTVFTAGEIDRRREPLVSDLLRTSPGAMVVRVGAPGGVTSLFVRGGESNYNKVLLDGIPLNEPGGTFNFSNLTTDNLDRVEIVRGAQSALFGSDAVASVVQLFTKRADRSDPHPHTSVSIEGGTFDTVNVNATTSGVAGPLDYSLGAARLQTDNQVPNDKFGNTSLSANVGVDLGHAATLRVIGRGELEHAGAPGATAFERPDLDAFFERHDGMGGVVFTQQVTRAFRQRATYSLAVSNQTSTNLTLDPPYTAQYKGDAALFQSTDFLYDSLTKLRRHHASYQGDWRLGRAAGADQLLTVLGDWDGERIVTDDRLAASGSRASRNNVGAAIEHQALWSRTFVTLGARVEHNDSFGSAVVPRGSVVFVAHQASGRLGDTRLRAAAGLGIKEPTVLQSFSTSPYFLGNPNLLPERSRTAEFGLEQRLAGDRVKIEATLFANRFHNLISLRTTDPAQFFAQYFNIGTTRARGAELSAEIAPVRAIRARAGYTFLDSDVINSTSPDNVLFQPGATLFRRPRHSGYAGMTVVLQRFTADVSGVFIGRDVDSDFSSFAQPLVADPGYQTWDARVSYQISRQLTAIGSIDNVANASYMEPLGYPALGRAGRIGIKVAF